MHSLTFITSMVSEKIVRKLRPAGPTLIITQTHIFHLKQTGTLEIAVRFLVENRDKAMSFSELKITTKRKEKKKKKRAFQVIKREAE